LVVKENVTGFLFTMMNRNKLYLANFSILNVKPAVSITVNLEEEMNESAFRSILSLCKQWYIKDIYLKVNKIGDSPFLKYLARSVNDQYLFEKNDFQFNFGNKEIPLHLLYRYHQREKLENEELINPFLVHTSDYEVMNTILGKEYVTFNGNTRETYSETAIKNIVSFTVKYPQHIKAIYVIPDNNNLAYSELENVTDRIKIKKNQIFFNWDKSNKVKIYILRQIDGWFDKKLHLHFNYTSSQFWHEYLNFYSTELGNYTRYFNGWFFTEIENRCGTACIPVSSNMKKKLKEAYGNDIYKIFLTYWYNFPDLGENINYILNKYYLEELEITLKQEILSNYSLHNKEMYFFIDEEAYDTKNPRGIKGIPAILTKFLPHSALTIDSESLLLDIHYIIEKQIIIKLINSLIHQYGKEEAVIHFSELLNFKGSFENKIWQIHWLLSLGISKFNFSMENPPGKTQDDFFSNIPTEDPCYSSYPEWFAYINQISHLLKSGIHRADILILYPEESFWYNSSSNLSEIINALNNSALDYEFTDFNTFINKDRCIIDKNKIYIHQEVFSFLILPEMDRIPAKIMKRIYDFYNAGGIVIALGKTPARACEPDNDVLISDLAHEIWFQESSLSSTKFKKNQNGGKGYFHSNANILPDIIYNNPEKLNFRLLSEQKGTRTLIRELPDCYYFYIFNTSKSELLNGTIISRYKGFPYCWNFKKVEPEHYYNWYIKDNFIYIPFSIPPKQIKLFLLKKESLKEHIQIIKNNLYKITSLQINPSNISLEGLVKKEGDYDITIQKKSNSRKINIHVKKHVSILKINENNWNISINNKKIIGNLGDLCFIEPFYSGKITYRKIIIIPKDYLNNYQLILDLGKVCDGVSVTINNKEIVSLIASPYECDITDYVKAGENLLHFELFNSLANRFAQLPNASSNGIFIREAGLFGPVRIIPYKKVKIECKPM
jgi:hypothetical protein